MAEMLKTQSPLFAVRSEVRGDRAQVSLIGELDAYTDHHAHEALAILAAQGIRHFRIDLSELTFVGSSGINVLTRLLDEHPSSILTLVGASPLFRRLLTVTGMDAHLALVS
jgi:stage II sporulation protein AA (anti-sigma F factor antagonist)